MALPSIGEWPWIVYHKGHEAWYQRALLRGDFAPGKSPLANYAINLNGKLPKLRSPMRCCTCHAVPNVNDLDVFDRATKQGGFLRRLREGLAMWPSGTRGDGCQYCNNPSAELAKVKSDVIAAAHATTSESINAEEIAVCPQCAAFLRKMATTNAGRISKGR